MLTENEFIETYLKPLCRSKGSLSLSDDAAILTPSPNQDLIISKDILIAGHHFFADDRPDDIAYKALAVNLSDIAAKGATPKSVMLGIAFPNAPEPSWAKAFCRGLSDTMEQYSICLLGGDTTGTKGPLVLSITIFGEVESGKMVKRSGAQAGDHIYASGYLGDAALGYQLRKKLIDGAKLGLSDEENKSLIKRYLRPTPRSELASLLKEMATSAMDLSDGVIADLEKLSNASDIGAKINLDEMPVSKAAMKLFSSDPNLKNQCLSWGDDYEILATISPENSETFLNSTRHLGLEVTRIGECLSSENGITYLNTSGEEVSLKGQNFHHF
jgi:thiamine-monophosphate kinase